MDILHRLLHLLKKTLVKQVCFISRANKIRKVRDPRKRHTVLRCCEEHIWILSRADHSDCNTRTRTACHANNIWFQASASIYCIILTSSSCIEVIKAVYKTAKNILIDILVGTATSRDETPCIRSTHNRIAVLRPCRLEEKLHSWMMYTCSRVIFLIKTPVDLTNQGNMAGVCFGPATRPQMLQFYPRWKVSSTESSSVVMYGVLLGESLSADWSNVTRVILHISVFSRARCDQVFWKKPEEKKNDKTRSLINSWKNSFIPWRE